MHGKGRLLKSMVVFDTNAVLRYILQDNDEMANAVDEKIQHESCFVPIEVVAEMTFVLSKVYKIPRQDIQAAISGLLALSGISTTSCSVVLRGLEAYASTNLDFVDSLMAGYQDEGYEIFTFDKALKKYLQQ